ncbi:HRH4-like protein [Mya arenaria]|uniref:HRH4-like protein n=1 Tax=Mya arenaria TaxID=6604 RepID=A0ABY7DTF3_MYAAR|nr:HRH4-like protein [Mya arenaria]
MAAFRVTFVRCKMGVYNEPDNYYYGDNDDGVVPMTLGVQIPSAIGLALLIVISITGNALTVVAYLRDKHLNTVYDFYIFNLGVADLLLSCISLPFYTVYTLMEFTWPFGYTFCKIYLLIDFTLCFETIVLMLIISFDRLLMITLGPSYLTKVTLKAAIIQIAISWVLSFLVYGPAIIGWNHWVGYSIVEEMDCDAEFAYDRTFTTITAFVEFILPFVCLTVLNFLIFFKIRQRMKVFPSKTATFKTSVSVAVNDETRTDEALNEQMRKVDDKADSNHFNRQRKAARFLAMLVAAFLIFWAPYTITTVIISFCEKCVNISLYEFFNFVLWMKSAVNPFLYAYNSPRYRRHFWKFLSCNGKIPLFGLSKTVGGAQTTVTSA